MPGTGRGGGRGDLAVAGAGALLALLLLLLPSATRESLAAGLRRTALAPLLRLEARSSGVAAGLRGRDTVLRAGGAAVAGRAEQLQVAAENAALRALLGLSSRLRQGFVVADLLPGPSFESDFTLAVAAGARVGVAPFQPVVTARGLVGMVERADADRSQVITWAHPDFAASGVSADGSAFGIVKPHLGRGAERMLLEMRGVRFRSRLDTGAVIVTSGLGSTFPRGIVIGTVVAELATPEQWARTYLLRPAVLVDGVGPVVVLTEGADSARVASAWITRAQSDSAARRAASAGDSLAALEAVPRTGTASGGTASGSPPPGGTAPAGAAPGAAGGTTPPVPSPRPVRALPRDSGRPVAPPPPRGRGTP